MPELVGALLVFVVTGIGFIAANLTAGRLFRPNRPDKEKSTIYECGEEAVGSAWVQFDVRFYVVALLFVIFDVEMTFFFPWAVVFGSAMQAADAGDADAKQLAWLAFGEMAIFFAILLIGFAYLWRRGDLDWVRSLLSQVRNSPPTTHQRTEERHGLARRSV